MKRFNNMTLLLTTMSVLVLVIAACGAPAPATVPPSGSAQGATGTAEVRATDAPPTGVTKIMVTANNIQVHNATAAEDTWVTLIDKAITFDLVAIQGVEMLLGTKDIAEGKYTQIRLDVSKVVVTIQGKDYDAKLPGEKLKVVQPWEIKAGQKTILTLDFDADKFVVVTGQNDVQVKPVIKLDVTQGDRPLKKSSTTATGVKFDFSSVTKSAGPNDPVSVTAQTEPNAECTIDFFYSNGNKSNLVFQPPNNVKKADASGKVQFDGAMYRQVTTGTATIQVSVNSSGKTGVFKTTIEVVATSLSPGQASPTPSPSPAPTPAPAPGTDKLFIDIVSISPSKAGAPIKVEVKTLPGAKVSLFSTLPGTGTVSTYPADKADKPADSTGKVVWEWTITDRARSGEGTMEFTAVLGDQTVKKSTKYTLS